MPLSIRLKPQLEQRLAEYSVRKGISKSAVIAKGVESYLDQNAEPALYELYERFAAALRQTPGTRRRADRPVRERYADYVKAKHARRARR